MRVGVASGLFRWDSGCHEEICEVSSSYWLVHVVLGVRVFVKRLEVG